MIQGDTVIQPSNKTLVKETENTTVHCNYDGSTPYLFWYIQDPSQAPQLILSDDSKQEDIPPRFRNCFSASHDKTEKTFHLNITAAVLSDSATYFCALSTTGTNKLVLGKGTLLTVEPKEKSKTAAFVLGSDKDNKEDKARACLITDFSSHNISVTLNGANIYGVPSVIEGDKQYSVVAFLPESTERSNFNCKVNGKTTGDNNDIENVCESDLAYVFESDEKLNSLSLMVLGLRVIFLKSIAFNVLMTVRAWMS